MNDTHYCIATWTAHIRPTAKITGIKSTIILTFAAVGDAAIDAITQANIDEMTAD